MGKLYFKGLDAYCCHCHREMYAMVVSDIMKNGGKCTWCDGVIDKGESILWGTIDKGDILSTDMSVQHISNILDMFDKKGLKDNSTYIILENELLSRNESRLPFKPYYSENIENAIRRSK